MEWHLAHINIGTMKGPITSGAMRGFRTQISHYNSLADGSPGFVWRLQTEAGDTAGINVSDDDRIFVTMSIWEGLEALFHFTYRSDHAEIYRQRREWFELTPPPVMALWWIKAGSRPTLAEALEQLERVTQDGPTPTAFTFGRSFYPDGSEYSRSDLRNR